MAERRYCWNQIEFEKNKCCVFNDVTIADCIKYRFALALRLKGNVNFFIYIFFVNVMESISSESGFNEISTHQTLFDIEYT